ncbi:HAD family hydrolase [Psychromonas arctica]|uniref:HAD family hydrolase n=1 Tax=Psychromonas arctica TaxID=168275 RepID=A0ABU9HEN4_9GAMM
MDLIIFDCDGTLVDSEYLCNLALQQQLAELGIDSDAEELMALYRGVKLNVILTSLESEFDTRFPDSFIPDYRLKVKHLFEQHLKANEGVKDLLASLKTPFCVASSAPRDKIEQALQVAGLAQYFNDNIFSSYEIDSWKPEPGIFLHAAKKMKVEPAQCYVVEDSLVGLQAANGAKMQSIYYAPMLKDKHPLATIQIKHMAEIINIIKYAQSKQ